MLSDIKLHFPRSMAEAVKLLSELPRACVMAGGTDLLVDIKQGLIHIENIVSLSKIKELKGIRKEGNRIRIGAMVTPKEIASHNLIQQAIPALAEAAKSMAAAQIRTMATIGGNIASAVPSADLPPTLIAADASVRLECMESSREIPLLEFFTGPRITVCREEEILTSIVIPLIPPFTGVSYKKFTLREANALAVVSVAARLSIEKEIIQDAAIVLGAVAPTPILALKSSEYLCGKKPSRECLDKASSLAKEEGKPIADIRGSIWYRKELIQILTRRALKEALNRAQGKIEREK